MALPTGFEPVLQPREVQDSRIVAHRDPSAAGSDLLTCAPIFRHFGGQRRSPWKLVGGLRRVLRASRWHRADGEISCTREQSFAFLHFGNMMNCLWLRAWSRRPLDSVATRLP